MSQIYIFIYKKHVLLAPWAQVKNVLFFFFLAQNSRVSLYNLLVILGSWPENHASEVHCRNSGVTDILDRVLSLEMVQ